MNTFKGTQWLFVNAICMNSMLGSIHLSLILLLDIYWVMYFFFLCTCSSSWQIGKHGNSLIMTGGCCIKCLHIVLVNHLTILCMWQSQRSFYEQRSLDLFIFSLFHWESCKLSWELCSESKDPLNPSSADNLVVFVLSESSCDLDTLVVTTNLNGYLIILSSLIMFHMSMIHRIKWPGGSGDSHLGGV